MVLVIIAFASLLLLSTTVFAASSSSLSSENGDLLSISLVNQDPDPVTAGSIVEMRLSIENKGGQPSKDVNIEVIPEYPFTLVSDAVQDIGIVNAYSTGDNARIIKYKLKIDSGASAGTYPIKISSKDGTGSAIIQNNIAIDVKNTQNAEVIYIDKTVLVPGQESNISFTITNVGSAPLKDLSFSWVNADDLILPVGSDNTRYINNIDVGKNTTVTYTVIADTNSQAGLYKLSLSLSYDDSITGTKQTTSTIAGVYVGGDTDFDVAVSDSSSGTTSFSIANIGSNPANSVTISIPSQMGWTVTGSNSMIIGNLNKGDYTVASFKLSNTASGNRTGFVRNTSRQMAGGQQVGSRQATQSAIVNQAGSGQVEQGQNGSMQNFRGSFNQTQFTNSANFVTVRIIYTNTMGQRQTVEKQVSMSTSMSAFGTSLTGTTTGSTATTAAAFNARRTQNSDPFSQYWGYLLGVVVLVVAFVAYRMYKRKKFLEATKKAGTVHVDIKHKKI